MIPAIETFPTAAAWASACATRLTDGLAASVKARGRAVFAGSGGSTPTPIYRVMSEAALDWSKIAVTLVDERYVPATSPDSNARLLKRTLLTGPAAAARFVPLFHPSITVDRSALIAARALGAEVGGIDVVLLGMGEDGHICSMFPGSPTLESLLSPHLQPTVLGVPAGRDGAAPSMQRLSINLPYLVRAERVILALTGDAKRAVFEREAAGDPVNRPIAALIEAGVSLQVLWTETA
ncbi:6-phosphogluconolactonase [Brevundimonas sp.]|uniref:6-phosphogluconolactonase n=1 Tax=Brevundimonas sp. TaxID=1871086 RepID=UPI003A8D0F32